MIEPLGRYLPQDRLRALARGESLPNRTTGSALFADISGFTPLTEQLTRQLGARRGIEMLTHQINSVYNALISIVEHYGGSVISFAGDAVTCWFDENESQSAPRAVMCAQDMQTTMQAFQDLSVKIAVSTGTVRRFTIGASDIRLMDTLAGATITRLATAEHSARPTEILLDETTATTLQCTVREWRTGETGERFAVLDAITLPAIAISFEMPSPSIATDILKPWLLSAVYEGEVRGQGLFLTELRPTVALFVRFTGIDYDDDDQAEEKLNTIICQSQRIVAGYEGTLLELTIGDKGSYFYTSFGAAVAHEDDAQRAVQAAIEIDQLLKGFTFLDSHQLGLSSGTMRTGAYGSPTRQSYGALGDDVNLAARLMTTATPGEILISGRIQKAIAEVFTVEPRAPLRIKGKAEPIPVFAVTGISRQRATRLPEPTYRLPMVGRQAELAAVDEKLNLALQGKGQIIGIVAEAGMGKSRLVAEIIRLARKRGFVGYGGACQSSGTITPYLVWYSIWQAFFDLDLEMQPKRQLRLLEGELEDHAPERMEALPLLGLVLNLPLPDNDFTRALDPHDRKGALEALLEDCLRSAARETPLLIVLEDLHWVDPLSHDLLETLARMSENLPVCFVLAYRPPDLARLQKPRVEGLAYFTRIELKDLTASDAEQLIRAKLAQLFPERTGTLPKALTDELTAKSQGNPFFIEELLNYLHDRGINPFEAHAPESLELPASLQTLILSRIDQLTEPQKATLKVASVIGRVFPFSWLYGYYPLLGDKETVKETLANLSRADLTPLDTPEPELAYIFKHIITQEVTYESLSYTTRAQLHELLARYLESIYPDDPPLDALAFHYNRSENLPKKREYLRKSAEAAYAVYSNETALEYYKQALALSPEQDELIDLHLKSGAVLQVLGRRDDAAAHYEAALQVAEEYNLAERIIECQIRVGNTRGEYQQSLEWLNKAHDLARQTNDSRGICDALNELSNVYWRLGRFDIALQCSHESLDLARQINDKKREAIALFFLATIHGEKGDYTESHKFFEVTLAIDRELDDSRRIGSTLLNWGTIYYYEGDYQTAHKYIEDSLNFYREIGDKRAITIGLNNLGNIFYSKSDYQTARHYYQESLALGRELADRYTMSIAVTSLGITAFQEGNYEEAHTCYQEGMALSHALGHQVSLSLLHCYLGLLALARKQISSARESFQEGLAIASESNMKAYVVYNLIGYACIDLAENTLARAATLLGAAAANAEAIGLKIEPELQRPYEQALLTTKEGMSEAEFQVHWGVGRNMSLKDAVKLARTSLA
jgi:adenylate cyclase